MKILQTKTKMNMTDNTILESFLKGFNSSYFVKVGNYSKQLFIGKDDEGRFCFEFIGKFTPVKLQGSSPLIVCQYKGNDTENILRFSLEKEELVGCFSSFCEDLIAAADLEDDNAVYRALSNRYQEWKKLFKSNHKILSEFEVMGLLGELLFLQNFAFSHWGKTNALESWTGPENTHKDFSFNDEWYEIKCISSGKETVRISSIEQLDSDVTGTLYIYCLEKMIPSYNGITLNKLVSSIFDQLGSIQKDIFLYKLEQFGYDFSPDYNNLVYAVTDESSYLIEANFPRITREQLPNAISKVQYDLILSEISKYKH